MNEDIKLEKELEDICCKVIDACQNGDDLTPYTDEIMLLAESVLEDIHRPLTAKDICNKLNICRQTLYKLVEKGKIERTTKGGQARYILR